MHTTTETIASSPTSTPKESLQICSFLPAATQTLYDLGLEAQLQAVTFECPSIATNKPKIVRYAYEGKRMSSRTIDKRFSQHKKEGTSPYTIDEELLRACAPDVVICQDVCEVCQIDTQQLEVALAKLPKQPLVFRYAPNRLEEVIETTRKLGILLGCETAAEALIKDHRERCQYVQEALLAQAAPRRQVLLLEWVAPPYNCGHWIPDQIQLAGGHDSLACMGGNSSRLNWEEILNADPEVLILAPCGYTAARTTKDLRFLQKEPGWKELSAVQQRQIYAIDFVYFTQPSLSTLTTGIEWLAACFHPKLCPPPAIGTCLRLRPQPRYLHARMSVFGSYFRALMYPSRDVFDALMYPFGRR